jgi:hypothetical protein
VVSSYCQHRAILPALAAARICESSLGRNFSTTSHSSVASDVFPKMFLNDPTSQALHASITILYPVLHWHDPSPTATNSVQPRHFPGPNCFVLPLAHAVQLSSPVLSYDDPSFIVLTETKFSFRCIPVWDRHSPHRTRVEKKKTHVIMLSP